MSWETSPRFWWLYYLVSKPDRNGDRWLLYIGITSRTVPERWAEHADDKTWWDDVDVSFSEQFSVRWPVEGRRKDAERVERKEIRRLRPVYNRDGNRRVIPWFRRFDESNLAANRVPLFGDGLGWIVAAAAFLGLSIATVLLA